MDKSDVEEIVVAWLNSGVLGSGWEAHGSKPKEPGTQYVLVDRVGGPREAMVLDRASILIEVYHKDSRKTAKDKAYEIADRVIELASFEQNIMIRKDAVNSVVHLPNLISQYEHYQVYVDVNCRR